MVLWDGSTGAWRSLAAVDSPCSNGGARWSCLAFFSFDFIVDDDSNHWAAVGAGQG
jgi:hypothetical protein